jgi:VanZ family protein
MVLSRRHKVGIVSLLIYWPTIFVLTHIPIPPLVRMAGVSDKALHFIAYMVLAVLVWFSVHPYQKVNWRSAAVWWILFVMVLYGVIDEWLQGYMGRGADVKDFLANLSGTLTGLIILSLISFWYALFAVTGICIFSLTNLTRVNPADLVPVMNALFNLFGYGFFTMLWIQCMRHCLLIKPAQAKWLIVSLAVPIGFLATVELFSAVAGNGFRWQDVVVGTVGIAGVVGTIFLMTLLRRSSSR